ncbi:translation elongation factor 4 [bacterium]|nr:translation elongation factor 4 [bacterium]
MAIPIERTRNFCIIAHIDHGKSTLADRLIEFTDTIDERRMKDQVLDRMDLERERGITIKAQAVRMIYEARDGQEYLLNLIDTPGHVDFAYEVSRSLKACEGALLLVDAAQGVEAQTIANLYLAVENDLEIIPVLNKIDLPAQRSDEVLDELAQILGVTENETLRVSAKTGEGVEELLEAVVARIPPPDGDLDAPLAALIFDSHYDTYRGVVSYVRVFDGAIAPGRKVVTMSNGKKYEIGDVGVFSPDMIKLDELSAGQVGYAILGMKEVALSRVGDTITDAERPREHPLAAYKRMTPMVFCGLYTADGENFSDLRSSLDKLALNDSALNYEQESSEALGFGFRCGFLGLLHMEIVIERLEREYGMELISTSPSVVYRVTTTDGTVKMIDNPGRFPERTLVTKIEEPFVEAEVITPASYMSPLIELSKKRRGELVNMEYLTSNRVNLRFHLPLSEIIYDYYDQLKSISRGYASLDYHIKEFRESDLVKVDILINKERADALSFLCHRSVAQQRGRKVVEKLRSTIPRHLFQIPIQAAIGGTVIARENISALRKDVTAKCYGGDITRKRKLLERQKKGKARMRSIGRVEVPQEAFLAVLEVDRDSKG